MATDVNVRVKKHRAALRAAGLRPIQLWIPDTRKTGFADEIRQQCRKVAEADAADQELDDFMQAALEDIATDEWDG